MTRMRRRLAASIVLIALFGAACGSDDDGDTNATGADTSESTETTESHSDMGGSNAAGFKGAYGNVREAYAHMYETGNVLTGAIAKQKGFADEGENKAAATRATLSRLLGEHALLASVATTKGLAGASDFEAAAGALDENSVELAAVVGSVYGEEAQNEFLKQWRDHIRMFVDYTKATAGKDKAGQDKAVQELGGYVKNFGNFLATATGLPPAAVQEALNAHVGQLKGAVDAAAAGNFEEAYAKVSEAYHHMMVTADALAGGISKQNNLGDPKTKQSETDIALSSLLGEHAALAALATTKGVEGAPDFGAVAGQLDKNSVQLADLIGSVYGDGAKNEFLKQWRDHIRMFVDYTKATAGDDKAGQDKAVQELGGYIKNFGSFLATATGLPTDAVQKSLEAHVMQLKTALDDYAGAIDS
ncbi:MAG: copper amine oxidase [Acidimicrobiia bacterium]